MGPRKSVHSLPGMVINRQGIDPNVTKSKGMKVSGTCGNWHKAWGLGWQNVLAKLTFDGQTFKYKGHRQGRHCTHKSQEWDHRVFSWSPGEEIPDVHLPGEVQELVKSLPLEWAAKDRKIRERNTERLLRLKAEAEARQHKLF